jgi:hypothetical protein
MAFLAPVSFDLADGHSLNANFVQGFFDVIEFEGLDDRLDFLHAKNLLLGFKFFYVSSSVDDDYWISKALSP